MKWLYKLFKVLLSQSHTVNVWAAWLSSLRPQTLGRLDLYERVLPTIPYCSRMRLGLCCSMVHACKARTYHLVSSAVVLVLTVLKACILPYCLGQLTCGSCDDIFYSTGLCRLMPPPVCTLPSSISTHHLEGYASSFARFDHARNSRFLVSGWASFRLTPCSLTFLVFL